MAPFLLSASRLTLLKTTLHTNFSCQAPINHKKPHLDAINSQL